MTENITIFRSCPLCGSLEIKKDGITVKGFQRFTCNECGKYWQSNYIKSRKSTLEEVKADAEKRRLKKIASLKKQLEKLEKMRF